MSQLRVTVVCLAVGDPLILDEIVAHKKEELAQTKLNTPLSELISMGKGRPAPLDFTIALRGDGVSLIAEIKKASPSKGLLCPNLDAVSLGRTYAENGAAAISILTESRFFQGSLSYLEEVKGALSLGEYEGVTPVCPPLLRKDFIFDPYQVYEARAAGADALLLITAILAGGLLAELLSLSHELGLSCLVEVHDEGETERALAAGARIIGINNRDLRNFHTNTDTTRRLRPLIPDDRIVVSESGIKDRADMLKLREWNVQAALIGEALVVAPNIGAKVRELACSR